MGARDVELQVQGERGITGDYRSDRGDNQERVLQPLQAAPAPKQGLVPHLLGPDSSHNRSLLGQEPAKTRSEVPRTGGWP